MHVNDEKKTCIGKIIKESCVDMKIHYPKYVNYFDIAKDKLSQCRESKVEFKEMLDGFYLTEGCNKQPLEALLIRPVQRLPSISLLVNGKLTTGDKNLIVSRFFATFF